jgi:hypothetical protein
MILESGDMPAVARMIDDILSNIPRVDLRIFVREGSHPFFEKGDMSQIASAHVVVLPQRVKGIGSRDFGPEFLKSVGTQYYRGRTIWCGYIVLDDVAKKWSRRKMEAELGSIIDQKRNLCLPPEKEEQEAA